MPDIFVRCGCRAAAAIGTQEPFCITHMGITHTEGK